MGVVTYKNLQDAVLTYGYGEVDRLFVKQYLNEAYAEVARGAKWDWLQATVAVATVAGTATVSLPTSPPIRTFGRLKPNQLGLNDPEAISEFDFREYAANHNFVNTATGSRGMPRWYSVFGGKLNFYPVPDAVYNYTMQYWRGIGTMPSADSDVYLMDDDDTPILTLGALTRLGLRENNMWKYNIAQDKFVQALAQMLRNAKVEQSQTIRRAPMNYQYSGVYDDDQQR